MAKKLGTEINDNKDNTKLAGTVNICAAENMSSDDFSFDVSSLVTFMEANIDALTFANNGLKILDTDASHTLEITTGSNLTANHILSLNTGDSDRTITLTGNATLNQDVSTTGTPTFASISTNTINTASGATVTVNSVPIHLAAGFTDITVDSLITDNISPKSIASIVTITALNTIVTGVGNDPNLFKVTKDANTYLRISSQNIVDGGGVYIGDTFPFYSALNRVSSGDMVFQLYNSGTMDYFDILTFDGTSLTSNFVNDVNINGVLKCNTHQAYASGDDVNVQVDDSGSNEDEIFFKIWKMDGTGLESMISLQRNVGGVNRVTLLNSFFNEALTVVHNGLYMNESTNTYKWNIQLTGTLTADRDLIFNTGNADRTITLTGDATLNQDVSTTGSPTFAVVTATSLSTDAINGVATDGNVIITPNGAGTLTAFFNNSSTSGAKNVVIQQSGSGDAALNFLLTSVETISIGIDNSDSDFFKITSTSGGLNTTTGLAWNITNAWYPQANNTYSWGKSGNLWTAIWATNGTIQTSDINEKENIINARFGLDFICSLRPVEYNWKGKQQNEKQLGFIGQEVKQLLSDNQFENLTSGLIIDDSSNTMGMNYSQIIPILVKAIQELNTQLNSLKN